MRGDAERQANMLLAVTPDSFIPEEHPIRRIKPIVESALARLSSLFDGMYADRGRPSIPPEHLLKASLLIALYSIRSERQLCERLRYDLLFKWFLDLNVSDEPFGASSFSKNRGRLLAALHPSVSRAERSTWPTRSGTRHGHRQVGRATRITLRNPVGEVELAAPSLLPCLRRRHFGDQCMPAPDEASSLLGQGDDLAAATASAQVLAELLKRRAEACR